MNLDELKELLAQKVADGELEREEFEPAAESAPKPKPVLHVSIDRKGRKGKTATLIEGFDPDDRDTIQSVAARLKQQLATGGSTRGGEILIQGDCADRVRTILRESGYKVK